MKKSFSKTRVTRNVARVYECNGKHSKNACRYVGQRFTYCRNELLLQFADT